MNKCKIHRLSNFDTHRWKTLRRPGQGKYTRPFQNAERSVNGVQLTISTETIQADDVMDARKRRSKIGWGH